MGVFTFTYHVTGEAGCEYLPHRRYVYSCLTDGDASLRRLRGIPVQDEPEGTLADTLWRLGLVRQRVVGGTDEFILVIFLHEAKRRTGKGPFSDRNKGAVLLGKSLPVKECWQQGGEYFHRRQK